MIHIRLFHHRQELPGIGGQRLHIASLPFSVEGVKSQGRFAGAGQAGDHDQFVPGNVQVDILEIVGACTAHLYGVHMAPDTAVNRNRTVYAVACPAWQKQRAFYAMCARVDVPVSAKLVIYVCF